PVCPLGMSSDASGKEDLENSEQQDEDPEQGEVRIERHAKDVGPILGAVQQAEERNRDTDGDPEAAKHAKRPGHQVGVEPTLQLIPGLGLLLEGAGLNRQLLVAWRVAAIADLLARSVRAPAGA